MQVNSSIDHLFRHEYGKIVSYLTARYGSKMLDRIEDAVQDALLKAMQVWAFQSVPRNPSAWLYRVANNRLIDQLRRDKRLTDFDALGDISTVPEELLSPLSGDDIADEQLKMIFACCHPAMTEGEQIMLSLKLLCGLSVREIAAALLKKEEAVKKAITRARKKFQNEVGQLSVPSGPALGGRHKVVLKVIYLLFNEGYKATSGDALIKKDICEEAIRLAGFLYRNPYCRTADLCGLLALMCFHSARFDARISKDGQLLTLKKQDRSLWDKEYMQWGTDFLNQASIGNSVSRYQLEAGIAGYHADAVSFEETNWEAILSLYDLLERINPGPMVALNRLVVVDIIHGTQNALEELHSLKSKYQLENNYMFHSIHAEFLESNSQIHEAAAALERAIHLSDNAIEMKFLEQRLKRLKDCMK